MVIGDVDPALPTRRIALPASVQPLGLTLAPGADRVTYKTGDEREMQVFAALTPDGAVTPLLSFDLFLTELGLLGTGPDGSMFIADEPETSVVCGCENALRRLAPGATMLGTFPTAGCLSATTARPGWRAARTTAGDRVVTLGRAAPPPPRGRSSPALRSPAARRPDCSRPAAACCSCSQKYASVAASCPRGCCVLAEVGSAGGFSDLHGNGRVRVELPKGTRTGKTVTVKFSVDGGPTLKRRLRIGG